MSRRTGKPSPSRVRIATLHAACTAWNAKHPIGTEVVVALPNSARTERGKTTSAAEIFNDHSAVISVQIPTARMRISLDRVTPAGGAA